MKRSAHFLITVDLNAIELRWLNAFMADRKLANFPDAIRLLIRHVHEEMRLIAARKRWIAREKSLFRGIEISPPEKKALEKALKDRCDVATTILMMNNAKPADRCSMHLRPKDSIGAIVRFIGEHRTVGGEVFRAGTLMRITSSWRGKFDCVEISGAHRHICGVRRWKLELATKPLQPPSVREKM